MRPLPPEDQDEILGHADRDSYRGGMYLVTSPASDRPLTWREHLLEVRNGLIIAVGASPWVISWTVLIHWLVW